MDEFMWGDRQAGGGGDGGSEPSFFISGRPIPELRGVAGMDSAQGKPEGDDSDGRGAAVSMAFSDCESSWQFNGLLLGETENDTGTEPAEGGNSWPISDPSRPKQQNPTSDKSLISGDINPRKLASSSLSSSSNNDDEAAADDSEAIMQMKKMMYHAAVFRPVEFGLETTAEKKRRKNVKISNEPRTVAARKRRERISEKIRVLQRLVPGGSKMDIASMLDEAANYLKFLQSQIKTLESFSHNFGSENFLSTAMALSFFKP